MDGQLREKLEILVQEHGQLAEAMAKPEVATDPQRYQQHARKYAELSDLVQVFTRYKEDEKGLYGAQQLLAAEADAEMLAMAEEEAAQLQASLTALEEQLRLLLVPKDPLDEKNTIVEIRAGTGGEEAALFAADLFRMYTRLAETKRWKVEVMNSNPTALGGFKEVSFQLSGDNVYSCMKWEGGVHRVQRVPDTETQGRIHTSAVTVAVLPEAEEVDIRIDPNDLIIDVYRSSGPGGQSVNTTDSAVRITYKPTGMVVTCQDEKSQHKNKAQALRVLRARLLDARMQEEAAARSESRRSQVRSGDRSEKIRTYNFPENRVTDHRVHLSLYRLREVLEGDLDEFFEALAIADRAERLAAQD
ncbi:MAG TPA: peptide chain release factor 1 [Candidatus Hydrogenedentes bacterium]|jgi:peptide chain release factor 1|nr:peptide chain release factor 1 [Candidatus Hydrogenedentota bacterium]HOR51784.1 peptide chain release factor 1 [Candidatus Hydrogenedentota bacterium]HPK25790.1 peptide chain release factor 1 [Candidatus Hydrogenedentota bacterium]HPX87383.1 peptide chain release factor 1 [Candidatus Hydrogenedentota bacterium]